MKPIPEMTCDEVDEEIARARGWITRRRDGDIGPIDAWEPGPSGVPAHEDQWLRRGQSAGNQILAWAPIYSRRWALAGPLLEEMARAARPVPGTTIPASVSAAMAMDEMDEMDPESAARAWLAWHRAGS